MKHTYTTLILLAACLTLQAKAPKFLTKSRAAQVTVIATDASGTLHEAQGVFVSADGQIVTDYDALKGAVKATVIGANGREWSVRYVLGANSMYNVARICVSLTEKEKVEFLTPATQSATAGTPVFVLPNAKADKKALATTDTIAAAEKFRETYDYYTLSHELSERQAGCPVLNEAGELVGLVQLATKSGQNSHAIGARFATDLSIGAIDAGNNDLRSIQLQKRLPDGEQAAASYIFLLSGKDRDSTQYMAYVDDFIRLYPASASGYVMRAEAQAAAGNLPAALEAYNTGLAQPGVAADELHFSLSKTIYGLNQNPNYETFQDWTLEKSVEEAAAAYKVNALPVYLNQEAHALYAAKKYSEACEKFLALTKTNLRTPELFLYAAQCLQMQEGTPADTLIALQDSAVNCYSRPYPREAATAILMRATTLEKAGRTRDAIRDLNEYEHLTGNLNANFYYEREQMEVKCRMYPAAMNDIERAIRLAPTEPLYYAECAALNYRVGQTDDAMHYAEKAIELAPDYADAYRILGVCLHDKGKPEARKYLQKAVELGDKLAQNVLDKMK